MNHSPRFALIDGKGRIRGYYDGAGPDRAREIKDLEADIRELLARGGS